MTFYIQHNGQQYSVSRINGKDAIRRSDSYQEFGPLITDTGVLDAVRLEDERAARDIEELYIA